MSDETLKRFLLTDGGGILSGASFEKHPRWSFATQMAEWAFREGLGGANPNATIERVPPFERVSTIMEVWK